MSTTPASPAKGARGDWVGWLERRLHLTEIFSLLTHFGLVLTPIDTSRPVREVAHDVMHERIPRILDPSRVLGVLAVVAFVMQAVTGLLLAYYYQPTPDAAFSSTRMIVRDVPAGWLIHQVHAWGAILLIAAVSLRLLRLFWEGLYAAPREILWMLAVAIVWLAMQLDFTGRLLVWDTQSYWQVVRGMELISSLPVVGPFLAFLLGGHEMSGTTLIRFYVLHVVILPLLFVTCIYLSFDTIRRVGLSPAGVLARTGTIRYRHYLFGLGMLGFVVTGIFVTLAVFFPFHFLSAADPYTTPPDAQPPWYMAASYAVVFGTPLPVWLGGGLLLLVAIAIQFLPFWLRRGATLPPRRTRAVVIIVLALYVALTILGSFMGRRG